MAHINISSYVHEPPFPRNYGSEFLLLERGKGITLYDTLGKSYIDFGSGIAVNSLGYGRKDLAAVAAKQMKKLIHVSNLYATEPGVALAQRMVSDINTAIPEKTYQAIHFGNSGTEAMEAALKYARRFSTNRNGKKATGFIAFTGSFHGRSMGALSITSTEKYRSPFEPLIPGVRFLPYNDPDALHAALKKDSNVAAIILEVIQGEGGLTSASPSFISSIRQEADSRGIPVIVDEIQTGLGRTGRLLACQGTDLKPDIICMSKPLAGGLPLSATIITEDINSEIQPGDHGTTFGGGPVTTAVAAKVWDIINEPKFLTKVRTSAAILESNLLKITDDFSFCGHLLGEGMLRGIPINLPDKPDNQAEQTKNDPPLKRIMEICRENGLLILRAGANVLRIAPPLIASEKDIQRGTAILRKALQKIETDYQ